MKSNVRKEIPSQGRNKLQNDNENHLKGGGCVRQAQQNCHLVTDKCKNIPLSLSALLRLSNIIQQLGHNALWIKTSKAFWVFLE